MRKLVAASCPLPVKVVFPASQRVRWATWALWLLHSSLHDLFWGPIKTFSDSYWWSGHWRCTSCSKLQILPYSVIWRFIGRVTCQDMDPLDSSPLCDSPLVWNMCEWSGDTHSYRRPPAVQSCMCGFTQAVVLLGLKCFLLSLTSLSPPCSLCMSVPLLQKFVLFSFPPHRCVWQNENKSLVASGPFLEVALELCRMWL